MFSLTTLNQFIQLANQNRDKKVLVFGTGLAGKTVFKLLEGLQIQVDYFIDNQTDQQGMELFGVPIYAPSQLLRENQDQIAVYTASMYYREMKSQLDAMSLIENRHFWHVFQAEPSIKKHLSRYEHLLNVLKEVQPERVIEIGVWRGDRAEKFLEQVPSIRKYVGFDLFEEMTDEKFEQEKMGNCVFEQMDAVLKRLERFKHVTVEMIKGDTTISLPAYVAKKEQFDLIFIDGGHSVETIHNDWFYAEQMLAPDGVVVFDDYYLNDDTRGARALVDYLMKNKSLEVRFLPVIESIVEGLQITMAVVKKRAGA